MLGSAQNTATRSGEGLDNSSRSSAGIMPQQVSAWDETKKTVDSLLEYLPQQASDESSGIWVRSERIEKKLFWAESTHNALRAILNYLKRYQQTANLPVMSLECPLPKTESAANTEKRLEVLQEWRGRIVYIGEDKFEALLTDITRNGPPEIEHATIPLKEISDRDRARIFVDMNFSWVIAFEHAPNEPKKRVSQFVFHDLVITDAARREGEEWADKMLRFFNQEQD